MRKEGQTVMFVAADGKLAGLLAVSDPIKETTPAAIRQLHEEGLQVVMLTGDNRATAEAVAAKLGIDQVVAEVLPDEKADAVKKFQDRGPHGGHGRRRHQRRARPWPRPRWASPWAPAPTSPWNRPASPWSRAI